MCCKNVFYTIKKRGDVRLEEEKKEITIQDVINKKKEKIRRVDSKLIMKVYEYAAQKHGDQRRKSGEHGPGPTGLRPRRPWRRPGPR